MVKKDKKAINANRKKAAAKKPVVSTAIVNKPTKASGNFDKVYKTQKNSSWQKFVEYFKKRPILMVLIPFLILGAGFVTYNQYQIYQEQQDFKQAEAVLDDLANNIADELGKPIKFEKEKSCSYRSEKFNSKPGKPTCGIYYVLLYEDSAIDESKIQLATSDTADYSDSKLDLYGNFKVGDIDCGVFYRKPIGQEDSNFTGVYLNCTQLSSKEYYPVD